MYALPTITSSFAFTHKGAQQLRMCGATPCGLECIVDCVVRTTRNGTKVTNLRMHSQVPGTTGMRKAPVPAAWVAHLQQQAVAACAA